MGLFRRKTETESEKIAKISKQVEKEWTSPSPKWSVDDTRIKALETLHENGSLLKKSKDTASLNMFSLIAFEYKRYEEAIEWAKCALAINPKNKKQLVNRLINLALEKTQSHTTSTQTNLITALKIDDITLVKKDDTAKEQKEKLNKRIQKLQELKETIK